MELKNTIVRRSGCEYASPGSGTHVMGLVKVQNCECTYKDEPPKPGIEFTFRCMGNPNAGVAHQVRASLNEKSSLFKTLKRMTKGAVNESTSSADAFELIRQCVGKWFDVTVLEKKGYARVDDCDIRPARDGDAPDEGTFEYFAGVDKGAPVKKEKEVDTDDIPF
jgi:hypothetical protein